MATFSLSDTSFLSSTRAVASFRATGATGESATAVGLQVSGALQGLLEHSIVQGAVVVSGGGPKYTVKINRDLLALPADFQGSIDLGGRAFVIDTRPPELLNIELDQLAAGETFERGEQARLIVRFSEQVKGLSASSLGFDGASFRVSKPVLDPELSVNGEAVYVFTIKGASKFSIVDFEVSLRKGVVDSFGNKLAPNEAPSFDLSFENRAPTLSLTSTATPAFTEDSGVSTSDVVATFTTADAEINPVTVTLSDTTNYALGTGADAGKVFLTAAGVALVNNGQDLPAFTLTPNDFLSTGTAVSV
ncbi:MAG: hypothetical protein ACOYNQ_09060, partial [Burkholderiales bacterium]